MSKKTIKKTLEIPANVERTLARLQANKFAEAQMKEAQERADKEKAETDVDVPEIPDHLKFTL